MPILSFFENFYYFCSQEYTGTIRSHPANQAHRFRRRYAISISLSHFSISARSIFCPVCEGIVYKRELVVDQPLLIRLVADKFNGDLAAAAAYVRYGKPVLPYQKTLEMGRCNSFTKLHPPLKF